MTIPIINLTSSNKDLTLPGNKAMLSLGIAFIESQFVPKYAKKKITVRRTWRERLFSRPWRPWVVNKVIEVEDTETPVAWVIDQRIFCHPDVKEALMKNLSKDSLLMVMGS